jgi:hypothetical protein
LTDLYTKTVLTLIAGALCVLATGQIMPTPARALVFDDVCGQGITDACWVRLVPGAVEITADIPVSVRVMN